MEMEYFWEAIQIMALDVYPINQAIKIVYQAVGGQTGISDLKLNVTDPAGAPLTEISMTETGSGLYEGSFTPNTNGRWWAQITSALEPQNALAGTYFVNGTVDSSGILRLAVDAQVTSNINTTLYKTKVPYDNNYVHVYDVDLELFSIVGAGKLDFISISGNNSYYEVAIEIDGVEIIRITMSNLGSYLNLTSHNANLPIWVESSNRIFRWQDMTGTDFTSSFKLKVKRVLGSHTTIKWLLKYREKI